ncbi:hypothetical protein D3C78_1105970 [compost metagenome]
MYRHRLAVLVRHPVREHPNWVQATLSLDDGFRHVVQHHQTLVAVLDPRTLMSATKIGRYEEDAGLELWNRYFPVPAQFHDFLFARAAVDLVKRHAAQMIRQFGEENRLLFPGQRIGRPPGFLFLQLGDHRHHVEPGTLLLITPFPGAEIEDTYDTLQGDVHRSVRNLAFHLAVAGLAGFQAILDVRGQRFIIDVSDGGVPDIRIQLLQIDGSEPNRGLVLVLNQITGGCFPPGSDPAYAVDLLLAQLFQLVYQVLLRLLPVA